MFFRSIDANRYQILDKEGGKLLGTIKKETFRAYPDGPEGEAKEECFWLARSRGSIQVPGNFSTCDDAAQALIDSQTKFKEPKI